jgi:DNA-binding NarL/FixJ family response regulator
VKNNITSILRKLQVNDRTQAVIYALRHGWIDPGTEEAV